MKKEIIVPTMGESVSEAVICSFLAPSGSFVVQGQEILELETDKVNQVLYAQEAGQIHYQVSIGDTVKIGSLLGFIETDAKASENIVQIPKVEEKKIEIKEESGPTARKKTEDFIKDLSVEQEAPKIAPTTPTKNFEEKTSSRQKMTMLRKTIASRLVEVKNKTAMLTTFNEVDMTAVMEIRSKEKESFEKRYGVKLGFMSFFVKACVAALKEYPLVNAVIEGDEIVAFHTYDIGVAVSSDKGLLVPVIRNCESKSFGDIEKEIALQAKKTREGGISIDDLQGGTFTITNGGVFGSLLSTPILNPPQSAILGMHAIVKRPIALHDEVVIRPMMYVALSYDHRIIDGKEAVLFLTHIKASLEDPAKLLLDL